MKEKVLKSLSAAAAVSVLLTSFAMMPAQAEQPLSLNIDWVELAPDKIPEDRTVTVDVTASGNESGFLASEFGISFDSRLELLEVRNPEAPGSQFRSYQNPEKDIVWFSGANASPSAGASKDGTVLFTLVFKLPENYAVGDQYPLNFSWEGQGGSPAFWYKERGDDYIEDAKTNSIAGYISIPDSTAPYLDHKEITLNQGGTMQLQVLNATGINAVWLSDRPEICTVNAGLVTGVSPGSCTVRAFAGTRVLSCQVTVTQNSYYSMTDTDPIIITDPSQVIYLQVPDATGTVDWFSSNPEVATVSSTGEVKGVSYGIADIYATCNGVLFSRTVAVQFEDIIEDTTEEPPMETLSPTEAPVETLAPTEAPSQDVPYGDLTDDGKVALGDVIALNKHLLGLEILDESVAQDCDFDSDGSIGSSDALTLLRYVVELIDGLPL